jgi:hypothetical protein
VNIEFSIIFLEKLKDSIVAIMQDSEQTETANQNSSLADDTVFELDLDDEPPKENSSPNTKPNPPKEEPQTAIDKLFTGTYLQTVTAKEADGSPVVLEQDIKFMQVILSLNNARNIYDSLDELTGNSEIEEFTTPKGFKSTANKLTTFKELPPVLTFQIQRVDYDPQKNALVKNHSRFEFPQILYMDRYLAQNLQDTLQRRKEVLELKQQKLNFEQDLFRYTNPCPAPVLSVSQLLDSSIRFLADYQFRTQKNYESLLDCLKECHDDADQFTADLHDSIQVVDQQIESVYSHLTQYPYRLHAVLVHDGQAGSGHYWAFLWNPQTKSWYKYNDINVIPIDSATVWKESLGGDMNESAYCLIYLNDSPDPQQKIASGSPSPETAYLIIPPDLQAQVAEDNHEFEQELLRWDAEQNEKKLAQTSHSSANVSSNVPGSSSSALPRNPQQVPTNASSSNRAEIFQDEHLREHFRKQYQRQRHELLLAARDFDRSPNLESFPQFLMSIRRENDAFFEIAYQILREEFGVSLWNLPQADLRVLFEKFVDPPSIPSCSSHSVFRQIYENAKTTLEYLVQGLLSVIENS